MAGETSFLESRDGKIKGIWWRWRHRAPSLQTRRSQTKGKHTHTFQFMPNFRHNLWDQNTLVIKSRHFLRVSHFFPLHWKQLGRRSVRLFSHARNPSYTQQKFLWIRAKNLLWFTKSWANSFILLSNYVFVCPGEYLITPCSRKGADLWTNQK